MILQILIEQLCVQIKPNLTAYSPSHSFSHLGRCLYVFCPKTEKGIRHLFAHSFRDMHMLRIELYGYNTKLEKTGKPNLWYCIWNENVDQKSKELVSD